MHLSLPSVLDDPLALGTDLTVAGSAELIALKGQRQTHPHPGHLKSHTSCQLKHNHWYTGTDPS